MKPLTIEEIKQLKAGDWLWVVSNYYGSEYRQIVSNSCYEDCENRLELAPILYIGTPKKFRFHSLFFSDYNKTWVAYRNKEQAECKCELVELPYKIEKLHIGDTIYYIQEYFNDATLKHEKKVLRTNIDYIAKGYIEVNNGVWLQPNQFWLIYEQAEEKLKELRGEK